MLVGAVLLVPIGKIDGGLTRGDLRVAVVGYGSGILILLVSPPGWIGNAAGGGDTGVKGERVTRSNINIAVGMDRPVNEQGSRPSGEFQQTIVKNGELKHRGRDISPKFCSAPPTRLELELLVCCALDAM